jgi:hypothetical protein
MPQRLPDPPYQTRAARALERLHEGGRHDDLAALGRRTPAPLTVVADPLPDSHAVLAQRQLMTGLEGAERRVAAFTVDPGDVAGAEAAVRPVARRPCSPDLPVGRGKERRERAGRRGGTLVASIRAPRRTRKSLPQSLTDREYGGAHPRLRPPMLARERGSGRVLPVALPREVLG